MSSLQDAGEKKEAELTSVLSDVEAGVSAFLRKYRGVVWFALAVVSLLVLSPLVVFGLDREQGAKWAETVKNVVESAAVIAALFTIFKWVSERRDRATDVLLKLDEEFNKGDIPKGRELVEAGDLPATLDTPELKHLDALLRFYVVLYGVLNARQVPERSLSICFRYWLALYFRRDRPRLREYIDANYPTLSRWLRSDCAHDSNSSFFGAKRLFGERVDDDFVARCRRGAVR